MNFQKNKDAVFSAVEKAAKQAGYPSESITVIAVTKYVDSYITKELIKTGISHIGENRVDQFLEKKAALADEPLTWHFIGSLQRRKVKEIIHLIDYFHSLDSVKLAKEIDKRADKVIKCFLQVNISGEKSKHGFSLSEIDDALADIRLLKHIELIGLMTMAPLGADDEELSLIFGKMKEIQTELAQRNLPRMPFTELSMGMSGDFKQAIAHGATYVRIGSAFFK